MKEKIVGIIGGMGPEATRDLYAHIIRLTPAARDQDHLHTIIDSNTKIPDRTEYIVNNGEDPMPEMLASGIRLQRAGAEFLLIPCISAHYFLEQLRSQLQLPIISAFEAVAEAIYAYPLKNPVGLMGTDGTIRSGKFAAVLEQYDLPTLIPDDNFQRQVMEGIYTVKADSTGIKRARCKKLFVGAAGNLVAKGACCVIAGCTEIPLVLKSSDISVPLMDPLEILAAAAVSYAFGGMANDIK